MAEEPVVRTPLSTEEAEKEYPGPSEFTHLHSHTLFSLLDGCSHPSDYFKSCAERKWPAIAITEHGVLNSIPDAYLASKETKVKYVVGCFLPSQPVLLQQQVLKMSEVKPGDFVLTGDNTYQKVKNIQIRKYSGKVCVLSAWGVEDLRCTPEHPLLIREVIRKETTKGVWDEKIIVGYKKANELFRQKYWRTYKSQRSKNRNNKRRYRFYFCVPRLKPGNLRKLSLKKLIKPFNLHNCSYKIKNGSIEIITYKSNGYKTTKDVNLPEFLQLDRELLWIMGLWLAEGSGKDILAFSLGSDEISFAKRIKRYFDKFNITTSWRLREDRKSLDVVVYSSYFIRIFIRLLGKYFDKKRIHDCLLFGLDIDQTYALLRGLFDGDAKVNQYSSYLKLSNETLIWQTRLLMTRLGQYSTITPIRGGLNNISYSIRYREKGHFYYDLDDKYIYLPVYETSTEKYSGQVFNLEVENNHTYNVGVVAHNCEVYYNDFEILRRKLFAEGTSIYKLREENPDLASRISRNRHLTILAKNENGYKNILRINREAWLDGFYYKPRVWFDLLAKYKDDLIILSGCFNGPICHELRNNNLNSSGYITGAIDYVKKFRQVFADDFYLEVQMPGVDGDIEVFRKIAAIGDHLKIKTVLTGDCHYLTRKDFELQKIMMAIDQKTTVDNPNLFHVNSDEQFFKTRAELRATFFRNGYSDKINHGVFEMSCDATLEIADKCSTFKPNLEPKLPKIENSDAELIRLAEEGLKRRGLDRDDTEYIYDERLVTYRKQMELELKRIISKGFSSYFLITLDLIKASTDKGWPVGPGRGCTIPSSKIKMKNNQKKISDIIIGEEIIDGFGSLQIVENIFIYDVCEDLFVFELESGKKIKVTSDHKLYVIRDDIVLLLKASEIKTNNFIIGGVDNRIRKDSLYFKGLYPDKNIYGKLTRSSLLPSQKKNIKELQKLVDGSSLKKIKIKKITKQKYNGKVYDLQVSNTNCYILNGIISSNSVSGSLVSYLIGIHSLNPIKWGLSFNRFMSPSRGGNMLKVTME